MTVDEQRPSSNPVLTTHDLVPRPVRRRPVQTVLITVILAVFGVDLLAQTHRWVDTHAYGVILRILPAPTWGIIHLALATGMVTALVLPRRRIIAVTAHTLTVILLSVWEFSFLARWLTDPETTVVNVCSWGVYLFLIVWSAMLIDRPVP